MMHRTIRFGLVAVLAASLGGVAAAQGEDPCGGDEMGDPCGGDEGGGGDEMGGGDEGGGGDEMGGGDEGGGDTAGGDMAATDDAGGGGGAHALTLPKGKIAIWAGAMINLSKDAVAKPFYISPDVWYGVSDDLSAGLVHSSMGNTGFWGGGGGLCLAGEDNNCPKVYDNVGLRAKYQFQKGNLQLAGDGGIIVNSFDPLMLGLRAGLLGRWSAGKISVDFNPALQIGLTERDFNKEVVYVPVTVAFAVSDKLHAAIQTGIRGPLDGFSDAFQVPLSVGAMFGLNEKMQVGAALNFLNIAGKNSTADIRTLDLIFGYML